MTVRAPNVAGMFYPGDAGTLSQWIDTFLDAAPVQPMPFKALVAPHAGYPYSGPVAGTAYASVRHLAGQIRRVVLLGPAHRVGFRGVAATAAGALATPLGPVAVDRDGVSAILDLPGVQVFDQAFDGEHALEVHLPFLQKLFPEARLVPLVVGDARPELVDAVLARLWGGPETLIVISSDLSHYRSYEEARRLDLETSRAIEALQPQKLNGGFACGFLPVAGLLLRAMALDLRATCLDLRNSGDTAGDKSRVVGYGAYGFEYAASARLPDALRSQLLTIARGSLKVAAATGKVPEIDESGLPMPLRSVRRTFVTLTQDGRLRGCIGTLAPTAPLARDIAANTFRAAMQDPRFGPMSAEEVDRTDISVSILSHPRPMRFSGEADLLEQLRPEVDGLIIVDQCRQALFLPKVWHDLPLPAQFLGHLKVKAGLHPQHFSSTFQAFRFTAESFPDEKAAC